MILLVPEIHPVNLPLFLLLSLKHTVRAYAMQPSLDRFRGCIQVLDLANYMDREDSIVIKSKTVKAWEEISNNFSETGWKMVVRGRCLNFSSKAKQGLLSEMERLAFLKFVSDNAGTADTAIINSLKTDYLTRLDKNNTFFNYKTARAISAINKFLDKIYLMLINAGYFAAILSQYIYAFVNNNMIKHTVDYIYDGVSPRELSHDKGKITFSWIVDGKLISKDNILFLMPRADFQMRAHSRDYRKDKSWLVVARYNMLTVVSRKQLLRGLCGAIYTFFKYYPLSLTDLEKASCLKYILSVTRWLPLLEELKPRVYLSSGSSICAEEPAISYFNAIGIKTVLWLYSCNIGHFLTKQKSCDFREMVFSNISSSTLLVWDQHYKESIMAHPQTNPLEVRVIGPLMCGDENVMKLDKKRLCEGLGISYNPASKYVSIFDAPPVDPRHAGPFVRYPQHNTPEYNYAFMRDLYRLASDVPDIFLIYKPKRNLDSGKFIILPQTRNLIEKIKKEGRGCVVDYNINPWLPIAAADICVSMPFESPTAVALNHNKPALLHDPTNITAYHPYTHLSEVITHNYEELKERISFILTNNGFKNTCERNFSDEFRSYLNNEAKQRTRIYA